MSLPQTVFKAPFDQFVKDQITLREQVYARGRAEFRDMQDITYLNSRTGWVRLMSCVDIENLDQQLLPKEELAKNAGAYNIAGVIADVEASIRDLAKGSKQELAYKFILSNGVQPTNDAAARDGLSFNSNNFTDEGRFKHWTNNSYGLGASVQGIKPMPGITSADIRDFNNGALREAKIKIQAWDIEQLQILELLYMRLGFTMYLEWGHSIYASGKPSPRTQEENTYLIKSITADEDPSLRSIIFPQPPNKQLSFNAILEKIQEQRKKFEGNYDGFLGRVTNFNWSYNQSNESYDIELTMITVGSVIESLNMNTQFDVQPSYKTDPEFTGSLEERYYFEGQKTNLGNFLWLGRMATLPNQRTQFGMAEGLGSFPEPTTIEINGIVQGYGSRIYLDQITTTSVFGSNHFLKLTPRVSSDDQNFTPTTFLSIPHVYRQNLNLPQNSEYSSDVEKDEDITYVRFGDLLQWLERHNNETTNSQGEEDLIINIHYDIDSLINTMYVFTPYLFSADPSICVIKNWFEVQVTKSNPGVFGTYRYYMACDYFYRSDNENHGRTMNIYLNIAFLMECINSSVNEYENGMVSVFDFLTKVCNGINESLGHVCHLFPWLDVETSTLYIINEYDNNDSLRGSVELSQLQTSGYVGQRGLPGEPGYRNETGTIKDVKLTTGLSKDVQNTIAIGAAAQGVSLGQEAVSFLSWHKGLKDRVIPQLAQNRSQDENQREETRLEREKDRLENLIDAVSELAYTMTTINKVWQTGRTKQPGTETGYAPPSGYAGKLYHIFDKPLFDQAKILLKDYIHICSAYTAKEQGKATPYNGFLPLNFSLKMDGLSGMKIYQRFFLNARMVPPRYPILFDTVIKGINHSIQNNTWDTTIETFAVYNSIMSTTTYISVPDNPFFLILREKDPQIKVNIQLHGPTSTPTTAVVLNPNPTPTTEEAKQNLQTVLNELKQRAYSKEEAVGIAANMGRETGDTYAPTIVQLGGGPQSGYGLVQWTPFQIYGTNAFDTRYERSIQTYKFSNTYNNSGGFTTAGPNTFTTHTPIYVLLNANRYKVGGQFAYNTIKGQVQFLTDQLGGNLKNYIAGQFPYTTEPSYEGGEKWASIKSLAKQAARTNQGINYSLMIAKFFVTEFENPANESDAIVKSQLRARSIYNSINDGTLTW